MHYSDQQLEKMLRQDEGDLLSSVKELQHLESCSQCQQRLAELSGDQWPNEDSLEFVRQALLHEEPVDGEDDYWQESFSSESQGKQGKHRVSLADSITISVGPSGDWSEEAEQRQHSAKVNTDFLETALHPELMGRLGRYDVENLVGVGGFGIVFKAHDTELRRVVALKVLAPHLMSSVAARQRFAREAQTAAAIVHEHVIPIYDVVSNDKHCYLVMQYIAGQSLQDRVDSEGPLPIEDVLRIASQIAGGLDAAHQQGVVHRDVKPANILLEESVDRVLISDFGLARTADDANLTRSGVITGTPHYMSPEQASGSLVDNRSDLFSLGSVIYFMCTGRPPFRAPQIVAVLNRICNHAHRPVSQIQPQIPGPVSDLIDRLLSKDPAKRFRTAAAAKAAIGQLLADYQSGKLAADLRVAQKYQKWKQVSFSIAKTVGVVAASALMVWGASQAVRQWKILTAESSATQSGVAVGTLDQINPAEANRAVTIEEPDTEMVIVESQTTQALPLVSSRDTATTGAKKIVVHSELRNSKSFDGNPANSTFQFSSDWNTNAPLNLFPPKSISSTNGLLMQPDYWDKAIDSLRRRLMESEFQMQAIEFELRIIEQEKSVSESEE